MKLLDIQYDKEKNIFTITNNTSEEQKIQFWITDLDTNLNVDGWWIIFTPNQTIIWSLSEYYYSVKTTSGFRLTYTEFQKNEIIDHAEFRFKETDNKCWFNTKSFHDLNYGSWHYLVNEPELVFDFKDNEIVYDLGANVGVFTMLSLHNKAKTIYAFEPDTENVYCMRKTFFNNPNVFIIEKAILDKERIHQFKIWNHSVASGFYIDSDKSIDVECINLEQYAKLNHFKLPTILKCDIEGSEFIFLEHTTNSFFQNVRIFILEYHYRNSFTYSDLAAIIRRFINLGYCVSKSNLTDFCSADPDSIGTLLFERKVT
jgi:FkbM family methyltransferase